MFRNCRRCSSVTNYNLWNRAGCLRDLERMFDGEISIKYYVDNNSAKWGKQFAGKPIKSPESLREEKKGSYVVAILVDSPVMAQEIKEQLRQMDVVEDTHVFYYTELGMQICSLSQIPERTPRKMNFSRGLQFKYLCEDILNDTPLNNGMYIQKIDDYVDSIRNNVITSHWNVTSGDLTFIKNTEKLADILKNNCDKAARDLLVNELLHQAEDEAENKLKIVFFAPHLSSTWPSLEGVYHACVQDEHFITQLVYIPGYHHSFDDSIDHLGIYKDKFSLQVLNYDEYNISDESPDVVFFANPYDFVPYKYAISQVKSVVNRCCYLSYGLEMTRGFRSQFLHPFYEKIWRHIVYGEKVKEVGAELSEYGKKNIVAWGHPRVDLYRNYKNDSKNISVDLKNRIAGRKVILWCPHHSVADNSSIHRNAGYGVFGTFFKWKDEILEYFNNNCDMFLIFRSHPIFRGMIVNGGYMSELEYDEMELKLGSQENVIIDKSELYMESFHASDAIITDGTTFAFEYLLTGNPLLLTYKPWYDMETGEELDNIMFKDEYFENVDIALEKGDVIRFIEMVRCGDDYRREKRKHFTGQLFTTNSGGNGEYIKNKIYEELLQEETMRESLDEEFLKKRHALMKIMKQPN